MPALGTRALTLTIDDIDFSASVSSVKLTAGSADSDFVSFADAAAGGSRSYGLDMTLTQDLTSASLWRMIYDSAGDTVDVVVRPNGGHTPSAAQPEVRFEAVIAEPDGDLLGGEANSSTTARLTTDVSWSIVSKPVIVTG